MKQGVDVNEEVSVKKFGGILAFSVFTGAFIAIMIAADLSLATRLAAWTGWFVAFYLFNRWKAGNKKSQERDSRDPTEVDET